LTNARGVPHCPFCGAPLYYFMIFARCIACVAALLTAVPSLTAQKRWTLEECIGYALHNNTQLKQHSTTRAEKDICSKLTYMKLIPYISAYIGNDFNWGRSVDMQELIIVDDKMSSATNLSLTASVNLTGMVSSLFSANASRSDWKISLLEERALRDDIFIKVVRAYMELLLCRQTRMEARGNCLSIEEQERKSRIEVEAGLKSEADLLEIMAKSASERAEESSAIGRESSAKIALMTLLGLEPESDFDILSPPDEEMPSRMELPSPEEVCRIVERLPQMESGRVASRMEQQQIWAERSAAMPALTISGAYGTYYSSTSDAQLWRQFNLNRNPSISVGITIPLLNGGDNIAREQSSHLRKMRSELNIKRTREELFSNLETLVIEASGGYERCEAARQSLISSEEVFRTAQLKYDQDAITSCEYIITRNNLQSARIAWHQARFQYIYNLIIINYYRDSVKD